MACRGTGRVISNLGGTQSEISCPWCEGTGMRVPGIDAQAHWPPSQEGAAAPAGGGLTTPAAPSEGAGQQPADDSDAAGEQSADAPSS
jgi:hypothetical protein